ncbi:MAG: divalent-cation tolerance protein CutA [Nitrospirota bacterium]
MTEQASEVVVLVTASSQEEAIRLANLAVERKLAACATVIPHVRSIYRWEGKIHDEQESLIVFKTASSFFSALEEAIKRHHSYSVPEIIALPIVLGSQPYLDWLRGELLK